MLKKKDILECRSKPIEYSEGQREALIKISKFLEQPDYGFFLLGGYSGCGKTTIAENIVKYSNADVLAPTNAAVNRLRDKIMGSNANFGTIHSQLFSPKDDHGNFKKADQKGFAKKKTYVIDEISMVDAYILNTIIEEAVDKKCKVIFLGDNWQLEPIGSDPKIFEWEKSNPKFFLPENKHTLTEVRRYDGSLLKIATELRQSQSTRFTMPEESDLKIVSAFTNNLGKDIHNNSSFAILTAINKDRVKFNKMVRQFKYRKEFKPDDLPDTILNGDRLISIANSNYYSNGEVFEPHLRNDLLLVGPVLLNIYEKNVIYKKKIAEQNDLFRSKKLTPEKTIKFYLYQVVDKSKKVDLESDETDEEDFSFEKELGGSSVFDSLFTNKPTLDYNQFILFSPDIEEPSFHGQTILSAFLETSNKNLETSQQCKLILFKKFMNQAGNQQYYFNKNVSITTYGYALSTHKSQGNEWDNVYIFVSFLSSSWNASRWFYTAITRAKNKVEVSANKYLVPK